MDEINYSETNSIFTSTGTFTSFSSTIPGIGALSGKAFKRFGCAVVDGVDAILIRLRLAQIETTFGQRLDGSTDPVTSRSFYSDLLELSRPVYSLSIRTRAFRLIMGKIGAMDIEDLATVVASWPLSESYILLKAMILSLRLEGNSFVKLIDTSSADWPAHLEAYCAAGLDAYKSHLPYSSSQQMPRLSLSMAFLLFMSLTISSSEGPAFSRLAIELDLITLITDIYPKNGEPKSPWLSNLLVRYILLVRVVLFVLLDKLDPEKDGASMTRLQQLLAINISLSDDQDPSSPFDLAYFSPATSKEHLLSSIRSNIAYSQSPANQIPYTQPGELGKMTWKKQIMKVWRSHTEQTFTNSKHTGPIARNTLLAFYQSDIDKEWGGNAKAARYEDAWSSIYYSRPPTKPRMHPDITYLQSPVKQKPHTQKCILLLGCGESGKTTLKKQMMKACRPRTEQAFTPSERAEYIERIVDEAFFVFYEAMKAAAMDEDWGENEVARIARNELRRFANAPYGTHISSTRMSYLHNIVKHRINSKSQKTYLPYRNDYLFDSLPRILSEGYLPSDEDLVRWYVRTTGIHTDTINIRGNSMTLLDFGGQRSERKKWIHGFQEAGIIFFVASLSDYNEVLIEDETTNRMQESLSVFDSIINSPWFDGVPAVLFLNKADLFAQKLHHIPLEDYFPNYFGGDDYTAGCEFIIDEFLKRNRRPNRSWDTRVCVTSIIDDEQVKNIMNEIYETYMDPVQATPQAPTGM